VAKNDFIKDEVFNGFVSEKSPITFKNPIFFSCPTNKNAFKFGMLITNSLNVRPTNNFYFGVEFGIGYTYLNAFDAEAIDREVLTQFGLKFGFIK
jgi:hypothetical protein